MQRVPLPPHTEPPVVVYAGGTAWDALRGTDQQLAGALSEWCHVVYVDPPVSLTTLVRARTRPGATVTRVGPSLTRVSPVGPPLQTRPGVRALTHVLHRRAIARAVRPLGGRADAVVVASLEPLLDAVPSGTAVLFGTDDFVAGARLMNRDATWLAERERRQLARADVVVVVSSVLAERWRSLGAEPHVVENGCDTRAFAGCEDAEPAPGLPDGGHALYVGNITSRLDIEMFERVAASGVPLVLVGPVDPEWQAERFRALTALPNVVWTGPVPYEELPRYYSRARVGLLPYVRSDFNSASSPLKAYEYLAAGLPVVASQLPVGASVLAEHVVAAPDAAGFAAATAAAAEATPSPSERAARRAVAATCDWSVRAAQFAAAAGLPAAG
ncbi:glycosyltransferase [Jiangella mangrovi]|uniref:Teichuronic acid biosynthesis glycosyltransferase TuaH n=1 Tax=Jiangella mangrovi TaxID=1524084 RepID=A0A7W9GM61_9ACTN|nr:glycosyltransferase [Jiangella mangrovi]MBB5786218.1 teichuronic acid biosynthesis glycosyltransferase TuaH [Jiangella mangrovi]